jgi:hypothetical protein
MTHPDQDVQAALVRLLDALCTWERNTGRHSVLILREEGGFAVRADSGKPLPASLDDITDSALLAAVRSAT